MDKVEGTVARGTGGLRAYVGRLRTANEGCINGIVFEGRTRLHVLTAQPDVRLVSVEKATDARYVTPLERPSLSKAVRDLHGAARRGGIAKGAKALLKRVNA